VPFMEMRCGRDAEGCVVRLSLTAFRGDLRRPGSVSCGSLALRSEFNDVED